MTKKLHTYTLQWTETHHCEAEIEAESIEAAFKAFHEGEVDGLTDCSSYDDKSLIINPV